MSWALGSDYRWPGRDIGYGVPAYCDHPDCGVEIDRGLGYVCGMINTEGRERGCGLFFCEKHLRHSARFGQLCCHCWPRQRKECAPSPDHPDWIRHKLTDDSWERWRRENPEWVTRHSVNLAAPSPDAAERDGEGKSEGAPP